jgi:hypothetical protein
MKLDQALDFAKRSAFVALDTGDVAGHRENIIDFLTDENASEFTNAALALFDRLTTN